MLFRSKESAPKPVKPVYKSGEVRRIALDSPEGKESAAKALAAIGHKAQKRA